LEEEEVATSSRARGIRIVKTETEIERRKPMSQKKFKSEQAFREIEKKPLKKFSHINTPVASPHGEAGWNTVIANQGEES
jgi:hypothetical protein